MSDHEQQQPAPGRGKVLDALVRAERDRRSEHKPGSRRPPSGGMMVHVVAYFGFTATGSSDDGRERHITTAISPTYVQQILQLQEAGATEEELHPVVAQAVTESYFTEWGTRAQGLRADFTHVQSIDFEF
ncbi:telomere-protecting terminal protein Tpg [Streptomyces cyaneofuscatus]|uniref:telomere-protecting terminal protein Tpg n=1 Tax=Streptomyces cyaneofuscatus TaxID=66883 RepID=UPI002FF2305E